MGKLNGAMPLPHTLPVKCCRRPQRFGFGTRLLVRCQDVRPPSSCAPGTFLARHHVVLFLGPDPSPRDSPLSRHLGQKLPLASVGRCVPDQAQNAQRSMRYGWPDDGALVDVAFRLRMMPISTRTPAATRACMVAGRRSLAETR